MLNIHLPAIIEQIPLIHEVYEDDRLLEKSPDAVWYSALKDLLWEDYREIGAAYYDALYHYNKLPRESSVSPGPDEDKRQAARRLLMNRPTMDKSLPVIYKPEFKTVPEPRIRPDSIAPGIVPHRTGGPKPKCFFAMFKSFVGVSLMKFAPEPENVHTLLISNLSFARVCGFIPADSDEAYWFKHVPSLRKLEQFDQIMREYGLWDRIKWSEVRKNIERKVINLKGKDLIINCIFKLPLFIHFRAVANNWTGGFSEKG